MILQVVLDYGKNPNVAGIQEITDHGGLITASIVCWQVSFVEQ
jgi:hypothetical protein